MSKPNHATLSPSSSHIWLNCPGAARLQEKFPDRSTEYSRMGTCAHSLCEHKLRQALNLETEDPRPGLEYLDEEMERNSDDYVNYVMCTLNKIRGYCSDPAILIEQKLDFSRWVPEGYGYGDCVIIADDTLTVIDYKNGEGVLVNAADNSQLMCYALGALSLAEDLYEIENVHMVIFQPRRDNVSEFSIDADLLLEWADNVLAPAAKLAYEGTGGFKAGEHCRFCRARSQCRARALANLEQAKEEFRDTEVLSDEEIAQILPHIDDILSWAADIKELALTKALNGTRFNGFKLVEGRSTRKYTDEDIVAKKVSDAGFDPYSKSVLGITAMTKLLGKKKFEELLSDCVRKAPGKPTLVKEEDSRRELRSAASDFEEINE